MVGLPRCVFSPNGQNDQKFKPTDTKYGPAKSRMTPADVQIPMWPMKGNSHLKHQQQGALVLKTTQETELQNISGIIHLLSLPAAPGLIIWFWCVLQNKSIEPITLMWLY